MATVYAVDGSTRTGKMEGLPRNEKATRIFQASFPGTRDFIVGPALVCDSEQVL